MMSPVYSEGIMKKLGFEKKYKKNVILQKIFSQERCYLKQTIGH